MNCQISNRCKVHLLKHKMFVEPLVLLFLLLLPCDHAFGGQFLYDFIHRHVLFAYSAAHVGRSQLDLNEQLSHSRGHLIPKTNFPVSVMLLELRGTSYSGWIGRIDSSSSCFCSFHMIRSSCSQGETSKSSHRLFSRIGSLDQQSKHNADTQKINQQLWIGPL